MSQSLITYLSIGAAIWAVSFFKITLLKKAHSDKKPNYWMGLGKTIDLKAYALVCTIIIPLIILVKIEISQENLVFLIPILIIAVLSNFERKVK